MVPSPLLSLPNTLTFCPERDVARPPRHPGTALVEHGLCGARLARPARVGNDAVGAEVVAALHDVHVGHGGHAFLLRPSRAVHKTGIAIGKNIGEIKIGELQLRLVQKTHEGFRHGGDAVGARHETHLRMTAHELLSELLGHASRHAHHGARIGPLHAAESAVHLLFRLLAHGTGIDEHHVGLFQRLLLEAQGA